MFKKALSETTVSVPLPRFSKGGTLCFYEADVWTRIFLIFYTDQLEMYTKRLVPGLPVGQLL